MFDRKLQQAYSRRRLLLRGAQMAAVGTGASLLSGCVAPPVALVANSVQAGHGITPRALPPLPAGSPYAAPTPPLDVKIGQMLMVGFRGVSAPENSAIVRTIREQHVGAVVLFEYNISPSLQASATLRNLTGALQEAAVQASQIPLLIAIDQEGGQVTRLREAYGFPRTVSAGYLGTLDDVDATYSFASAMASSLADHGVNLNLAPVVDVNVNPRNPVIGAYERSFSADPETVTTQADAFIRAHHDHGVLCTLKHFPGHGSSTGDTHLGFVDVTDRWSDEELVPYRRLIQAGATDAIMTAHIYNATLDRELPATLSQPIITGLLREQLGFQGVVISDDMQMRAISKYYDFAHAVQAAVLAGVDILAIANSLTYSGDAAARAHAAIRALVDDGRIAEDRIDASYARIMALKQRLGTPRVML